MELGSTLIAAVLVAICVLPLWLISRNRKRAEKRILQSLADIASQHNNNKIVQQDLCGDLAIGLTENDQAVVFFKQGKEQVTTEYIPLAEVQSCKIIHVSRTTDNKSGNNKVTDKLDLVFSFIDAKKPEVVLPFYDTQEHLQLIGELQLIQQWAKMVNDRLRTVPTKVKVS
ncbi:MAG: hypothetical protein DA408_13860 [Bacteroidetes bacterium]|nr:MAG: hypothetical protein C7N36_11885 [Bacteroidota bacterium]PTM11315.1 MAG: hypothetical protein DA408_13860 [Bacteroidota bacterium]